MSEDEDVFLSIVLWDERQDFRTREDFAEFVSAHSDFYAQFNLRSFPGDHIGRDFKRAIDDAVSLPQILKQFDSNGGDINWLRPELERRFERGMPPHHQKAATIIRDLYTETGWKEALGAWFALSGQNHAINTQDRNINYGTIQAYLYQQGVSEVTAESTKQSLQRIRDTFRSRLNRDGERADDLSQRIQKTHAELKTAQENIPVWWVWQKEELLEEANRRLDEALDKFQKVQGTYEETMRLDRPRAYWTHKAKGHEASACWYRAFALGWMVCGGTLLIAGIWCLFQYALQLSVPNVDNPNQLPVPSALLLSLGAMGAIASGVVFWIARLLVRMWLSEVHLGMDARERVTMVQSFLALTSAEDIPESQRELVLSALFRPTQDGIVKDDASTDPALSALVNRLAK